MNEKIGGYPAGAGYGREELDPVSKTLASEEVTVEEGGPKMNETFDIFLEGEKIVGTVSAVEENEHGEVISVTLKEITEPEAQKGRYGTFMRDVASGRWSLQRSR